MRPLVVYLDSSDYSTLSDPRWRSDAIDAIRAELLELAKSPFVRFAFSGAHLSEMAPLEAKYATAATARADLLVALCGRNAFISFDRLLKSELAYFANPDDTPVQILSENADWFPEIDDAISPIQWADTAHEIDTASKERGLNREQRRSLKRKLFKSNQPKTPMREWLAQHDAGADLTDILRLYPMRPQDAKVLGRFVVGQATATEAQRAFLESLRDPRWMMRWFAAHHDKLTPVTEWLRSPSRSMLVNMREIAAGAKELRRLDAIHGVGIKSEMLTSTAWQASQDALLLGVANQLRIQFHPGTALIPAVEQVDRHCPGLSTTIRSLHSALWDSVGANPRPPQESDFIDAVHAMYAPYVSVFRADRYMSPHVQKQVARRGSQVVSRLDTLPSQIRGMLHRSM